jgi:hypothetical protein
MEAVEWQLPTGPVVADEELVEAGAEWRAPAWLRRATAWRQRLPRLGRLAAVPIGLVAVLAFAPEAGLPRQAAPAVVGPVLQWRCEQSSGVRVVPSIPQPGLLVEYLASAPSPVRCSVLVLPPPK